MKLLSSAIAAGAVMTTSVLLAPTAADASTRTSASACLQGLSGPYDLVNSYGNVNLKCGDPTKGIIHINQSHPINEWGADDVHIDQCMDNIIGYGSYVSASAGNTAKRITRSTGGYAVIVWDSNTKDVITMYTSDSNNWAACARFPN